MRRVANPAFSVQNMRALVPVVFSKAYELRDKWRDIIHAQCAHTDKDDVNGKRTENLQFAKIDVCSWLNRTSFDVIGLAGLLPCYSSSDMWLNNHSIHRF